jgi:hypothetical protein
MFLGITQVGDGSSGLILARGASVQCTFGHIKEDGKCNTTGVFFDMVTVPDVATKI